MAPVIGRRRRSVAFMPELTTPRLILRKAALGDSRDIYRYASDPEVARHCLWDAHQSLADSRRFVRFLLAQYRNRELSNYVIVRRMDGAVIGTIGFVRVEEEHLLGEIGYSLARDCWNQGLMTEAVTALVSYAFAGLKMHRLEAVHELDNPASGRVLEKCGFSLEGTLRGRVFNKGRWSDVALWAMLDEDWRG